MTDDPSIEPAPKPPQPGRRKGFSFNISFGRKPPVGDARYQRLLERATKDAASSPDGTGSAADTHEFSVTFSDGRLRVEDGEPTVTGEERPPAPEEAREAEMWDRLEHIGTGAYPDTARVHRVLKWVVTALGLAIPVALLVLGIAAGESGETVFFMTLFGLIIGFMFITTVPRRL